MIIELIENKQQLGVVKETDKIVIATFSLSGMKNFRTLATLKSYKSSLKRLQPRKIKFEKILTNFLHLWLK